MIRFKCTKFCNPKSWWRAIDLDGLWVNSISMDMTSDECLFLCRQIGQDALFIMPTEPEQKETRNEFHTANCN